MLVDGFEQLVERVGKELYAFVGEAIGDFLHRDAGFGEIGHGLSRGVDVLLEARARAAVIAKRVVGGRRNGVDGVRADQLLDVQHVAIGRIFRAGAGPKNALRLRASLRQCLPARVAEDLLVALIGKLGVGNRHFSLQARCQ